MNTTKENIQITTLRALLVEAEKLHTASLDESMPEDETDELYSAYWEKAKEAASIISAMTGIEEKIALRMVIQRKDDLAALLARAA